MKDNSRSTTGSRRRAMARQLAVAAQVAFALPLLTGAVLLMRSTLNIAEVDVGFDPENVLTLKLEAAPGRTGSDAETAAYYASLVDAVRAVPGVTHAGLVNRIPLSGDQVNAVAFDRGDGTLVEPALVNTRTITPGYFDALGIRVIDGRTFTEGDDVDAPAVLLVDERMAGTLWPGERAVGRRLREPDWRGGRWATVVGVVAHVRTESLETDPLPQVYWSYRQWSQGRMVMAVRTAADPLTLAAPVTAAIRAAAPEQSVYDVRTMTDIIDRSQAKRRMTTTLMLAFAGASLLLSAVGIYGVIAFGVARRTREFGIRIAVGAKPVEVVRMVVWQGTATALLGSVAGLMLALAAAGTMRSIVFGVAPRDAASMVGATAVLVMVAIAASYLPARRAARVDPGVTLRPE